MRVLGCARSFTTGQDRGVDEAALRRLLRRGPAGRTSPTTRSTALAPPPVRRPRLRPGRPPPPRAPGHGRGGLRAGQDARAVRAHRRRAARPGPTRRRCCSPGPTTAQIRGAPTANPGGHGRGRHGGVASRRPPSGPSGSCSSPPAPPTCPWPTSAPPRSPPTASRPARITDVGVAGIHRLLGLADDARRRRRRRRGRRHGGRAGQRRRRPHRRRRSSPCRPASATAPASKASPRCWACWHRARGHHRRRHRQRVRRRVRRRCACSLGPASPMHPSPDRHDRTTPRLVPLLLRHRRRHGPRLAHRRRRRRRRGARDCCDRLPVDGWDARGRAGPARRHRRHQASHVARRATTTVRPHRRAHQRPRRPKPACPTGSSTGPLATFDALAEAEGRLHRRPPDQVHFHEVGGIDAIVDVVGTCAALEVLERRRGRTPARSPPASAWSRRAHGLIPNPAPAVVEPARAAPPPTASTSPSSSPRPPAPRCSLRLATSVRAAAAHAHRRRPGFGAGDTRARRPTQPHPGRASAADGAAPIERPAGRAARGQRRRRHRRGPRPRHRRAARRRRPRRLDHADRHEEGPPGPHRARARRPGARRRRSTGVHGGRDRHARRARPAARAVAGPAPRRAGDGRRPVGPGQGQRRPGQGRARRRRHGGAAAPAARSAR